jgi:hypothetical protein
MGRKFKTNTLDRLMGQIKREFEGQIKKWIPNFPPQTWTP